MTEKFIPVAVDSETERFRKDKVGEFARKCRCTTTTSTGAVHVVTASGKRLARDSAAGSPIVKMLHRSLKAWEELPAEERKPGAVQVGKLGPIDAKRAPAQPPPGCLILRVWNRQLGYDAEGKLRYTVAEDFVKRSRWQAPRFKEPANDFMWIPENEWRSLIPAAPEKGDTSPAPTTFALRLFRFHLDPARGFTQGNYFTRAGSKAGRLTLTVQDVSPAKLVLRLEGYADLKVRAKDEPAIYRPAILGYLEYDRGKKTFTRFDMVALGTACGAPRDANEVITPRKGSYPLGIAFALVSDPTVGERLRPRGARWGNLARYLAPKEKP